MFSREWVLNRLTNRNQYDLDLSPCGSASAAKDGVGDIAPIAVSEARVLNHL